MKKAIVPLGIIVLMVFGVFVYINRFTIFYVSETDGYVFKTNDMATNLASGVTKESPKIKYEKIKINENIYKSGKKYYVGESTKKNVVINYPVISEDSSSLLILSDEGNYVDDTFVKSSTYKNTIISDNTLYNGINNKKVDEAKYIFLELNNGVYVNLLDVTLTKNEQEYTIPKHSFIYFERSFLRYYYYENGTYRFKEIVAIPDYADVTLEKAKYDYYDVLISLGVLERAEEKLEEEDMEITPPEEEEEGEGETSSGSSTTTDSIQLPPPNDKPEGGANWVDKAYVKPEVKTSNLSVGVYSYKGHIDVYDPADRIYKAPTFEFKVEDQVYLRMSYSSTRDFVVAGLMPNTEYTVECYYNYKDEYDQKRKGTCLEKTTIKTKDIDSLDVLDVSIGSIIPDIKQVSLKNIKLKNNSESEVLYGVKVVALELSNGVTSKFGFKQVTELLEIKSVEFQTGKILLSGTHYDGELVFYDVAGNKLRAKGNKVEFETLKAPPAAELEVATESKNFTEATMRVTITNADNVTAKNYRYEIKDENGATVAGGGLSAPEVNPNEQKRLISNLKPEANYVAIIYCDYINNNGEWINNYEMKTYDFYTANFESLGKVPVTISFSQITSQSVTMNARFYKYNEEEALYKLMAPTVPIIVENRFDPDEYYEFEFEKTALRDGIIIRIPQAGTLYSNTIYDVKIMPYILSGSEDKREKFELTTSPESSSFRTLKKDAVIHVANGYLASGYADFDICIEDVDGAIKDEKVQLKFTDSSNSTKLDTYIEPKPSCTIYDDDNEDAEIAYGAFDRITANSLNPEETYQVEVVYAKYTTDPHDPPKTQIQENVVTNIVKNLKLNGTSADLKLLGMTNDVNFNITHENEDNPVDMNGVNLFDIKNKSRWLYVGNVISDPAQEIKIDDNEIVFSSSNGYKIFAYYIPELKNKAYSVSFQYSYTKGAGNAYIMIGDNFKNLPYKKPTITLGTNAYLIADDTIDSGTERAVFEFCNDKNFEDGYYYNGCVTQTGDYLYFLLDESATEGLTSTLILKKLKIELVEGGGSSGYSDFGTSTGSNAEHIDSYAGEFDIKFDKVLNEATGRTYPTNFYHNQWLYRYYVDYKIDGVSLVNSSEPFFDLETYINTDTLSINEMFVKNNLPANSNFEAEIGIEVDYGSNYKKKHVLETLTFSTETETRTIRKPSEFMTMHLYGYYLVDLEDRNHSEDKCVGAASNEPCINLTKKTYPQTFQGNIDFQGQKVQLNINDGSNSTSDTGDGVLDSIFKTIGGGGVVKNVNLEININTSDTNYLPSRLYDFSGIAKDNNGLISNINVTIKGFFQPKKVIYAMPEGETDPNAQAIPRFYKDTGHNNFSLIATNNYGTIENFAIELKDELVVAQNTGLVAVTNYGIIKNGYIHGKNLNSGIYSSDAKNVGVVVGTTTVNSKISNIYSMIDVVIKPNEYEQSDTIAYQGYSLTPEINPETVITENSQSTTVASFAYKADGAIIENAFVLDPRYVYENSSYTTSNRNSTVDPLIVKNTNSSISNLYYIGKERYNPTDGVSKNVVLNTLKSGVFLEQILNGDKKFNVSFATRYGKFPTLEWPSYMPAQFDRKLPLLDASTTSIKLISVQSVNQDNKTFLESEKKEYGDYFARIVIEIYNSDVRNLKLKDIKIEGINDTPSTSSKLAVAPNFTEGGVNNIHTYTIFIKRPDKYKFKYKIKDLIIDNNGTDLSCENGELQPYFECDYNHMLELDLYKEIKELKEIKEGIENGHDNFRLINNIRLVDNYKFEEFNAVLDGNNHIIYTVNAKNCLINELKGTVKNLNIETLNIAPGDNTVAGYAGLICKSSSQSVIDNVHIGRNIETTLTQEQISNGMKEPYGIDIAAKSTGTIYMGGIVGSATNTIISNSSVSNMRIADQNVLAMHQITSGDLYIGGIAGAISNTTITNSFVRKLDLEINPYQPMPNIADSIYGFNSIENAGGIVGILSSGTVENVYSTGTINAKTGNGNIGGIAGSATGNIRSAISKVNVYSNYEYLGGIVGYTTAGSSYLSKTLAVGEVLTSKSEYDFVDRTAGVSIQTNKNYAWNRQAINSSVNAGATIEELLTDDDLKNPTVYETKVGLETKSFTVSLGDYDRRIKDNNDKEFLIKANKILEEKVAGGTMKYYLSDETNPDSKIYIDEDSATIPKIYHTTQKDELGNPVILSDQEYDDDLLIRYIETFSITSQPTITYIPTNANLPAEPWFSNKVKLDFGIKIYDPDNVIDGDTINFTISDMDIMENQNGLQRPVLTPNGIDENGYKYYLVSLNAAARLNKYYDSYNIEEITYEFRGEDKQNIYKTKIKMIIPFYGIISNVEHWQKIQPGTLQNFAIDGDVDFTGIDNPNINLTFNKLIGLPEKNDNKIPYIKNLELKNVPEKTGLIANISSEIRSVGFENITIETNATGKDVGLITRLNGNMYGHLPEDTNSTYNIEFKKIKIKAPNITRVGMICGNLGTMINYVYLEQIYVKGDKYAGGFIAVSNPRYKYNIHAKYVVAITSWSTNFSCAGGVIGSDGGEDGIVYSNNISIEGVYAYGHDRSGGVFGYGYGNNISVKGIDSTAADFDQNIAKFLELPSNAVSGMDHSMVLNKVIGNVYNAGGVTGHVYNNVTLTNNVVEDMIVTCNYNLGGVFGQVNSAKHSNSKSIRNIVYSVSSGEGKVGGIAANGGAVTGASVIGCTIIAKNGKNAGGIIGNVTTSVTGAQVGPYIDPTDETNIIPTTISAVYQAGGIFGLTGVNSSILNCIVNAVITAQHSAGGLVGYATNTNASEKIDPFYYRNNIVANTTVTAYNPTSVNVVENNGVVSKKYHFVGGLIGRTDKYLRTDPTIYNNIISATIKAGSKSGSEIITPHPSEINGLGYIVGGSSYYYEQKTWTPATPEQESQEVINYFNFSSTNGDYLVNYSQNGKQLSLMTGIKIYGNSTLNGITYTDMINGTSHVDYYNEHYKDYVAPHVTVITAGDNGGDLRKLNQYWTTYFGSQESNTNEMIYFPYSKAANNRTDGSGNVIEEMKIPIEFNLPSNEYNMLAQAYSAGQQKYHAFPEFEVYAVDVDKINIEFKEIDPYTTFEINKNKYVVTKNVFTFYYDFEEDFEIKLTDNINVEKVTISADEVKNGTVVIGDFYYHLDETGNVTTNKPSSTELEEDYAATEESIEKNEDKEENIEEEVVEKESTSSDEIFYDDTIDFHSEENTDESSSAEVASANSSLTLLSTNNNASIRVSLEPADTNKLIENANNIYEDEILLDNQNIYNIKTGEITENKFDNLTLAPSTSLYDFNYGGQEVETYYYYSVINGERVNKQIYFKNGQLEIVNQNIDNVKNKIVLGNYNDENYLVYLGKDGKLYNLKDSIKLPDNFKNINIKSISTNVTTNSDLMLVEYKDGSYIAFNYKTGKILTNHSETTIGLMEYIKEYLEISSDEFKGSFENSSYKEAKQLVSELNKKSIEQVLKGDENSSNPELYSRKYSISYNPITKKYEVYELPTENSEKTKKLIDAVSTSVNSIIESNPVLIKYYYGAQANKINKVSAVLITIVIVLGIFAATIMVGRYYKKVRKARG